MFPSPLSQHAAHAYSSAISACAAGGEWQKAAHLFSRMAAGGITPDIVSCTALVTALAASDDGADKAEAVVKWMLRSNIKPNVRRRREETKL